MAKLISENPELLIYIDGKPATAGRLHITVLGGIKLTGLDRLKVTLKIPSVGDVSFSAHLVLPIKRICNPIE